MTALFSPRSKSTKVSPCHKRLHNSSRVTISPGFSRSTTRTWKGCSGSLSRDHACGVRKLSDPPQILRNAEFSQPLRGTHALGREYSAARTTGSKWERWNCILFVFNDKLRDAEVPSIGHFRHCIRSANYAGSRPAGSARRTQKQPQALPLQLRSSRCERQSHHRRKPYEWKPFRFAMPRDRTPEKFLNRRTPCSFQTGVENARGTAQPSS